MADSESQAPKTKSADIAEHREPEPQAVPPAPEQDGTEQPADGDAGYDSLIAFGPWTATQGNCGAAIAEGGSWVCPSAHAVHEAEPLRRRIVLTTLAIEGSRARVEVDLLVASPAVSDPASLDPLAIQWRGFLRRNRPSDWTHFGSRLGKDRKSVV